MWTLAGLGTGAAFTYNVMVTVASELLLCNFVVHGCTTIYFEAAVVIISLTLPGQIFELKACS